MWVGACVSWDWSSSAPVNPAALQPARRLNLLLVTIDTLRADRLGCYGYSKIETPNLDQDRAAGRPVRKRRRSGAAHGALAREHDDRRVPDRP